MIDLRSDTCSCPTEAMRRSMAEAAVGDDVYSDDPTVRLLEERTAALLGKEDAVYMVTDTMTNQVAIRAHTSLGMPCSSIRMHMSIFLRVELLRLCLASCPVCFPVFGASSLRTTLSLLWECRILFLPSHSLRQ